MAQNSLAAETSPYLLQHAGNPVEWFAWNDAALQKAKTEDKPIFLSIGYSSCHWCHVMAHESFENTEVAHIMNKNFVNIKVDREERPDIDDIYQKVCQLATGQAGWPLSIFLTPDQKPFYAGTYFPVLDSHGRPGFASILRRLAQAWREDRGRVMAAADNFLAELQKGPPGMKKSALDRSVLDEAAVNLLQLADHVHGGFGSAPKFPNSGCVSFLFRYARLSGISKFSEFGLKSLKKMARGGIFDQIGGGFHRYSTDAQWLVPHFEKMLYDNALIPPSYAEAYQITKDRFYLDIMEKTLDFVLRDMTSPDGAFYSAYDADSGGVEGTYYTWDKNAIKEALGAHAELFCLFYNVTDGGNWEGSNILCNSLEASTISFKLGIPEGRVRDILQECSQKLLDIRAGRTAPGLDRKIICSWNALMITALAKGYRVTRNARYLNAAMRAASFLEKNLYDGTALLHTYKDGTAKIDGYLEDYACLAAAMLDLFEVHPSPGYLGLAKRLGSHIMDHFWDAESASFFMTSDHQEPLIVRPRNAHDLSMPSGNSIACSLLLRLYHLTSERRFLDMSVAAMERHAGSAAENPFAFGYLLNSIYMRNHGPVEITVAGARDNEVCRYLDGAFLPESIMVSVGPGMLEGLSDLPFFSGKTAGTETAIYVCRNSVCAAPAYSIHDVESRLSDSIGPAK